MGAEVSLLVESHLQSTTASSLCPAASLLHEARFDVQQLCDIFNRFADNEKGSARIPAKSLQKSLHPIPVKNAQSLFQHFTFDQADIVEVLIAALILTAAITPITKLRLSFVFFDLSAEKSLTFTEFYLLIRVFTSALMKVLNVPAKGRSRAVAEAESTAEEVFNEMENGDGVVQLADYIAFCTGNQTVMAVLHKFSAAESGDKTPAHERISISWEGRDKKASSVMLEWTNEENAFSMPFFCKKHKERHCRPLTRLDVMLLYKLFKKLDASKTGKITYEDLLNVVKQKTKDTKGGEEAAMAVQAKMFAGTLATLLSTSASQREEQSYDIREFLSVFNPCSSDRHHDIYKRWIHEEERETLAVESSLKAYMLRPVIPAEERLELEQIFRSIDASGDGVITLEEMKQSQFFSQDVASSLITQHSLKGSDSLSLEEFLIMMCPPEYRIPTRYEKFLPLYQWMIEEEFLMRKRGRTFKEKERFSPETQDSSSSLPEVEGASLIRIQELFLTVDWLSTQPGTITKDDLLNSGLVPRRIVSYIQTNAKRREVPVEGPWDMDTFCRIAVPSNYGLPPPSRAVMSRRQSRYDPLRASRHGSHRGSIASLASPR
ncbi:unnamed protein product [Vitrella brassicaformis CCMP3155]|uniref:EF-hand domain-containing protein n=1 Tax=Vitrella brassicaformis (strain CCMP3155) TaxID=1169540 RepID=A0A0G4G9X8_VITBC|nr:unnamed protein product [Vitrella brassicaformis CCMP3155]|eukprot:CEM25750.1 unnamed protein product [Vitrella brassicaformis CCMP3155]